MWAWIKDFLCLSLVISHSTCHSVCICRNSVKTCNVQMQIFVDNMRNLLTINKSRRTSWEISTVFPAINYKVTRGICSVGCTKETLFSAVALVSSSCPGNQDQAHFGAWMCTNPLHETSTWEIPSHQSPGSLVGLIMPIRSGYWATIDTDWRLVHSASLLCIECPLEYKPFTIPSYSAH